MNRQVGAALLLLCWTPSVALADAVSPVLNFFHKDTWLPATIVTLVIVVIESVLIRRLLEQVTYLGALRVSLVLNLASSLAGTGLLLAFSRESYFLWHTMSLVLPLFLITLLTEIPLLRFLFRHIPLDWDGALRLGFRINLASYAAVFVLEIGLLLGWFYWAGYLDQKDRANWNHPELLGRASGLVYVMGAKHGFRTFDPREGRWHSLTNCPSIDPTAWDVEGRFCAFVRWAVADWKDRKLVIAKLPDFTPVHEISPTLFADKQPDTWQGVTDLSISPDQKQLALLFRVDDAVAYKDKSSYYDLGSKNRLIVLDLQSGREIARAPRWASGRGLCWLPDSSAVLFPSFRDEALYNTTRAEVRGDTSYGIGYGPSDRFVRSLYSLHIRSGKIAVLSQGYGASRCGRSGSLLVQDQDGFRTLDALGRELSHVQIPRLAQSTAVVSPSGDLLLARIRPRAPLRGETFLAIIDFKSPELRHVIDDSLVYRYDWVADEL